jgi:flagellar basal body-associated protein FliL
MLPKISKNNFIAAIVILFAISIIIPILVKIVLISVAVMFAYQYFFNKKQ